MVAHLNERRIFVLSHPEARRRAMACVSEASDGFKVIVQPAKRTDGQNERFHAMTGDIAKQVPWLGKMRSAVQWKVLLVSGHSTATNEGAEMIPGLEGEFVNIRESTAQMSVRRGASLIEYVRAWGDMHNVKWSEPVPETA